LPQQLKNEIPGLFKTLLGQFPGLFTQWRSYGTEGQDIFLREM